MGVPQEKGRKRTTGSRTGELPRLCSCPSLPGAAPPPPRDADVPGGRRGRLGNLSTLSEMSAEINLANPPRWPVTLISLKFQAD